MEIKWTKKSLEDLLLIYNYIKQDSEKIAREFVSEIKNKTNILADFPNIGKESPIERVQELVISKNYLLSYRINNKQIQILQIWHSARKK